MEDVGPILPNTRTLRTTLHVRVSCLLYRRSVSSIVGSCARSRSTLAAKSSASVGTTRSDAFRFSRSRRRRASLPTSCAEARPLRSDDHRERQREQGDVQPAHGPILAAPEVRKSPPASSGANPIGPLGR